jgi:hypothetical protein
MDYEYQITPANQRTDALDAEMTDTQTWGK